MRVKERSRQRLKLKLKLKLTPRMPQMLSEAAPQVWQLAGVRPGAGKVGASVLLEAGLELPAALPEDVGED